MIETFKLVALSWDSVTYKIAFSNLLDALHLFLYYLSLLFINLIRFLISKFLSRHECWHIVISSSSSFACNRSTRLLLETAYRLATQVSTLESSLRGRT